MIYLKSKSKFLPNNLSTIEWISYVDNLKKPTDIWQEDWVQNARDRIHNLNLSIPDHHNLYTSTLRIHIMFNEVIWDDKDVDQGKNSKGQLAIIPRKPNINLNVYEDAKGYKTIGIGFNMDRREAKSEWESALGNEVSFYDAREGKINITNSQAYKLLNYSIQIRESELQHKFGNDWDLLKPNEKITIISMYYNSPVLIGLKFTSSIKQYIKTKERKYLEHAFFETKYQSNPKIDAKGIEKKVTERVAIQKRMDREAAMLQSYKCPIYSKPGEAPIPDNASIQIKLGETIIPRTSKLEIDNQELDYDGNKKKYYIWRTQNDDKVRLKHQLNEGKIYHIDYPSDIGHPGDEFNCRCIRDFNIPNFVEIKGYSNDREIVRKYIKNIFDMPKFCIK